MRGPAGPIRQDLVLVGGGHSHLAVLRRAGMEPQPGVRVTLIAREADAPYSGMLPGLIAGHYTYDEAHVDLRVLARSVGVRFIHDEAIGLDLEARRVRCAGRPPVAYDVVSLDVGATPSLTVPGAAEAAVAVKPISSFLGRWHALRQRVMAATRPVTVAVVGGGAGGVELLLAVDHHLRALLRARGRDDAWLGCHLFSATPDILPTHHGRAQAALTRVLRGRAVTIHAGSPVTGVSRGEVRTADGVAHTVDEVLWTTEAAAAPWLAASGLAVDARGFVQVNDALQSVSHAALFASGDCAAMVGHTLEKSGVYAVRQGPVLAENLARALRGESLARYRPQRRFLSLVSTGDRSAVASRGAFVARGAWVWRWKDRIDRRFMHMYQDMKGMDSSRASRAEGSRARGGDRDTEPSARRDAEGETDGMRCGGCGAKVGAGILRRALARLPVAPRHDVLVGLDTPDDGAVVAVPPGKVLVHSVDFFRPLVDDPFLFGKLAATHGLGDIYAMGAEPQTALAVVTLPYGSERDLEETLWQLLAGAVEVFTAAEAALVGGHTSEGAELGLGFAVNGFADPERLLRKTGLRPGDAIVLTKPIGTGALFAAEMRGRAKGRWIDAALTSMLQSNREAADCLRAHGVNACTDVTGFGLVGHLLEMTRASGVDVDLSPSAVPHLEGALDMVREGIVSTLQTQNLEAAADVASTGDVATDPVRALLFDPQTAGGLLAGVPADRVEACVAALRALGYAHAAVIGRVGSRSDRVPSIALVSGLSSGR